MENVGVNEEAVVEKKQYIVVDLGNEHYGIDISYIDNIVRMQRITRVPKAQDYFRGIINLRGEIVPVMSLRKRLNMTDDEFTNTTRIIILKFEEHGLLGMIVDRVREVVTLDNQDMESASHKFGKKEDLFVDEIGKSGGELISILKVTSFIKSDEEM